jgi:hypothetical protein
MTYKKFLIVGALVLAACGGEENSAAPVAPIAPGTPSSAVPGLPAAPGAVPGLPGVVPGVVPGAANAAAAVTRTGVLGPGDQTLESGEYAETFTFNWNAGESHVVRLTSTVFDPYVIVRPPNGGAQLDNDDVDSNVGTDAGLTVACAATGQYTVVATSFRSGESGAFTLTIQ